MKYKFLPHTADVKFRAYGKTLEEQFVNAALATTSVMFDPEQIEPNEEKKIEVAGNDKEALLYNWLEEIIYLCDAEFFIVHEVKDLKIKKTDKGFIATAVFVGDKFKEKYKRHTGVKAVTYNEMEIADKYVQVVLDV